MLDLIYIFGHLLIVISRCYGRCNVKKACATEHFLKFHAHLEDNFFKIVSMYLCQVLEGLNSCISKKLNFPWNSLVTKTTFNGRNRRV